MNGSADLGRTYLTNSDVYFTNTSHNRTGIGNAAGNAAIENAADYNTLMILGRSGGLGGVRCNQACVFCSAKGQGRNMGERELNCVLDRGFKALSAVLAIGVNKP